MITRGHDEEFRPMAFAIPCAACGYRMQGNLVGITFSDFVTDGMGRAVPVPDGQEQVLLCRTCGAYFERGFGMLVAQAAARQRQRAAMGGGGS
jgi:hypothetical protein